MPESRIGNRYRFGVFELDSATGELRRKGIRVKLHAQPCQMLLLLLSRPGEIVTREELCRQLWPDGTFVDFEHGVNSAVNRLREALNDKAGNPRFIETIARRGYRFVAPVEQLGAASSPAHATQAASAEPVSIVPGSQPATKPSSGSILNRVLTTQEDLPDASHPLVQTLFVLLQIMYAGFYAGALANLAEINELLAPLRHATQIFILLIVTATILIPVRVFLLSAVLFHAPGMRDKFHMLWRFLLPLDVLWALAPFLLLHHINPGIALACTTLLVYSPFAQRSLILMGAGQRHHPGSATAKP